MACHMNLQILLLPVSLYQIQTLIGSEYHPQHYGILSLSMLRWPGFVNCAHDQFLSVVFYESFELSLREISIWKPSFGKCKVTFHNFVFENCSWLLMSDPAFRNESLERSFHPMVSVWYPYPL